MLTIKINNLHFVKFLYMKINDVLIKAALLWNDNFAESNFCVIFVYNFSLALFFQSH